jgi:3-hydroxypropionate dehydrogenase (NADP+)
MEASEVRRVACVGAGTIGSSWATHFARYGFAVSICDLSGEILQRALALIRDNLELLAECQVMPPEEIAGSMGRISAFTDLAAAVRDADFVIESGPETFPAKRGLFASIDALVRPDVVIASSSSYLPMSEIQIAARHPERCVSAHPFNPPHIVPLVEIVKGNQTSDGTAELVCDLMARTGKTPVIAKKEMPGFIANRLQSALLDEAFALVYQGVASATDVDIACKAGPGLRWAALGPLSVGMLSGPGGLRDSVLGKKFSQEGLNATSKGTREPGPEQEASARLLVEEMEAHFAGKDMAEVRRWRDRKLLKILQILEEP